MLRLYSYTFFEFNKTIETAAMGWRICLLNLPVVRPYYLVYVTTQDIT